MSIPCRFKYNIWMGAEQAQEVRTPTRTHSNDPRYGGLVYISAHTGTLYQQMNVEEKNMPALLQLISRRKALLHNNLLTIRSHFFKHEKQSSFACGSQSKIEMYLEYPYLKRSLEDELEEHSGKGQNMPEREVVRVFRAVVEALSFLAKNGTCHGDVKSSNVVFDHIGTPKLLDSYFIHRGKTAYEIVLEDPSSMSLLAPEQLERIKHRQCEDLSTIHESEMFMVGLTMMEVMTFESAMECYDLEEMSMVEGYCLRKRQELQQGIYSSRLVELVLRCVEGPMESRPSFDLFLKVLS